MTHQYSTTQETRILISMTDDIAVKLKCPQAQERRIQEGVEIRQCLNELNYMGWMISRTKDHFAFRSSAQYRDALDLQLEFVQPMDTEVILESGTDRETHFIIQCTSVTVGQDTLIAEADSELAPQGQTALQADEPFSFPIGAHPRWVPEHITVADPVQASANPADDANQPPVPAVLIPSGDAAQPMQVFPAFSGAAGQLPMPAIPVPAAVGQQSAHAPAEPPRPDTAMLARDSRMFEQELLQLNPDKARQALDNYRHAVRASTACTSLFGLESIKGRLAMVAEELEHINAQLKLLIAEREKLQQEVERAVAMGTPVRKEESNG